MSISAVSGPSTYTPISPPATAQVAPPRVDRDHDGDNDATESKAAKASEASKSTSLLDIKA